MRLHHVDHGGAGPVVVLLHAFPLDSSMWDGLVPLLASYRVVTVDLPGLGHSPVPDGAADMGTTADLVLDVLDHLAIDSACLFGISTGGYVALQLAAVAPQRVSTLVLGSTSTRLVAPDRPADRRLTAEDVRLARSTEPVSGSADEGLGRTAHREQPELVTQLRAVIAAADPRGVAWMARAIASRDDTGCTLRDYPGRVLLLFGSEDEATPPERGQEMFALRDAHRTSLVELPGTGHLTALEQPDQVAAQLLDFIG